MTPFEEFLLWDAKIPGSPADAVTHLIFRGCLEREIFETALFCLLRKTPRAAETIRQEENGAASWETRPEISEKVKLPLGEPFLVWRDEPFVMGKHLLTPISLTDSPGVRFTVFQDAAAGRTDVLFHFHHVTTDAIGSFRFLEELFAIYAGLTTGEITPESCVPTEEELKKRPSFGNLRTDFSLARMMLGVFFRWVNPWKKKPWVIFPSSGGVPEGRGGDSPPLEGWLRSSRGGRGKPHGDSDHPALTGTPPEEGNTTPAAMQPPLQRRGISPPGYVRSESVPERPETFLHAVEYRFSLEETRKIVAGAKSRQVTVNDLLTAAIFLAAGRWRKTKQENPPQKRVFYRLALPVNVRNSPEEYAVLGNVVSILFLNRTPAECDENPQKFLAGIAAQTQKMKLTGRARLLLRGVQGLHELRWGEKHPRWGMELYLRRQPVFASFVLSNLGVLFASSKLPRTAAGELRVGNSVLEDIKLGAPRTINVGIFFPVGTYAGQLRLSANYDARRMSREEADLWLRFFAEEIFRFL